MIAYRVDRATLEALLEQECPGWLTRAAERTEKFRSEERYAETGSIWSEVKPVYMRLQGESKCAYCERKLESVTYGAVEQDVEHFRPKKGVRRWRAPASLRDAGIAITDPVGVDRGYYLLAYHPYNYAAACKPCNSALKRDYFPIAGAYQMDAGDPETLQDELPLLIYPLGTFDTDPEHLIEFYGTTPRPVAEEGHARCRALTTLTFFHLADPIGRKNLFRERALILCALFPQLEKVHHAGSTPVRDRAMSAVSALTADRMPHANCARSFCRLYAADRPAAEANYEAALELLGSMS